jgi:hypothetical protein
MHRMAFVLCALCTLGAPAAAAETPMTQSVAAAFGTPQSIAGTTTGDAAADIATAVVRTPFALGSPESDQDSKARRDAAALNTWPIGELRVGDASAGN